MAESQPNLPGELLLPLQDRCRLCATTFSDQEIFVHSFRRLRRSGYEIIPRPLFDVMI